MGFILTTLPGIGGSFVSTYAGQALGLYKAGEAAGFVGAVIGAELLSFCLCMASLRAGVDCDLQICL